MMTRSVYPAKPSSRKAMTKEAMMETRKSGKEHADHQYSRGIAAQKAADQAGKAEKVEMIVCTANRITM